MWSAKGKSAEELYAWRDALTESLDGKWSVQNCAKGVNSSEGCAVCNAKVIWGVVGDCENGCPLYDAQSTSCSRAYSAWHSERTPANAHAVRDHLIATRERIERAIAVAEKPGAKPPEKSCATTIREDCEEDLTVSLVDFTITAAKRHSLADCRSRMERRITLTLIRMLETRDEHAHTHA